MRRRLEAIVEREGLVHGMRTIAVRSARKAARTANAGLLGWRDGSLPLGSTVLGARHVHVGSGFDAAQPVWLEAVTEYAGERFEPVIRIGDRFSTSGRLHVSAIGAIAIGEDCLFGSNVYIGDHGHGAYRGSGQSSPEQPPRDRRLTSGGPISIGDRVWLGDNVVVLQGVRIGDGAVVGANSVVTRDVPAGSVAAGSPARILRRYEPSERAWLEARTPQHGRSAS
jgi:lipopolysaccharide O-acetyltransferase